MKVCILRWTAIPMLAGLVAVLSGCGGSEFATAPVTGSVTTADGKAVSGGSLTFAPVASGNKAGKPASATVEQDGSFKATGVVVGKHRVTYTAPVGEIPKDLKPGQKLPGSPFDGLVPKTSEVEVKSGANEIKVELVPASTNKR
jgi:hypothetical protein